MKFREVKHVNSRKLQYFGEEKSSNMPSVMASGNKILRYWVKKYKQNQETSLNYSISSCGNVKMFETDL